MRPARDLPGWAWLLIGAALGATGAVVLVVALTANDPLYREEMIFGAGGVASHPEGGQ